ncbi:MAG: ribosome maturation factor RimM [Balneolaceae bacterium]
MEQSAQNRFTEIGRIGRPRGLDGVVRFMPNEHFLDGFFDHVDLLYVRDQRSDLIPVRVDSLQIESKRNQTSFFVKFDMIANRSDAEKAMNRSLFVEKALLDQLFPPHREDDALVIGYTVYLNTTKFGDVLDVMDNPAHPILEVKHGTGTLLIPMVETFVLNIDHSKGVIYCQNLDRLLEE